MIGRAVKCPCGWEYDSGQNYNCPNCLTPRPGRTLPVTDLFPLPETEPVRPERPSWDEVWMSLASTLARRSTCKRLSVGCVVVSDDNTCVLGIGYNGGPLGGSNECQSDEPGLCGHLHAEINALIKTNYRDAAEKKAYITTEPCYTCAVALVNAGIREVIYRDDYRKHDGVVLLKERGIGVRKVQA